MEQEKEVLMEKMTWPEIRAALEEGCTTAVFACGATEQHGPHLPLSVDAEHGTVLAEKVARTLGRALVAPTVRVGCSDHHLAFPGTLSIQKSTLEAICRDYCISLSRHGFRRICIIPSHGGNFSPLAEMLPRLRDAAGTETAVDAFTDLDAMISLWTQAAEEETGFGNRVGGHADIAESSIMLVLHPEMVRRGQETAGCTEKPTPEFLARLFREGFRSVSPNGILGDANGMTETIGRRCIDGFAGILAAYFGSRAKDSLS